MSQFNFRGALSTLVLRWFCDGGYVRMIAEKFAEGTTEHAHPGAVNDADARETRQKSAVEEAFHLDLSFIGGAADDVDLRGHVVGVVVGGCDRNASAFTSGFKRGDDFYGLHFGNVIDGGAHLQLTHRHFEGFGIDDAVDSRLPSEGFEFHQIADLDAFGDVGLGGGIVLVGTIGVGDDGGVELFRKLADEELPCDGRSRERSSARLPCRRWL